MQLDDALTSLQLEMTILRATGEPLEFVSAATIPDPLAMFSDSDDEDEPQWTIVTHNRMVSWNEPIEFPEPTPLLDSDWAEFDDEEPLATNGEHSRWSEAESAESLIAASEVWLAEADNLRLEFSVEATIDGEPRRASTTTMLSRSGGMFETAVRIDDEPEVRLLWTRHGLWLGDESDGAFDWSETSPDMLGFDHAGVDDFLGEHEGSPLLDLLPLFHSTEFLRTLEGGGDVYEVNLELDEMSWGDPGFELVAEALLDEITELLAVGVEVEAVEFYSTTIVVTAVEESFEQTTEAEFVTDAGVVSFTSRTLVSAVDALSFSAPPR